MDTKTYILLVDDEPDILATYTHLLRSQNYGIKEFLSATEALAFLRFTDKNFDLFISDLNMPVMDGIRFMQQVRKMPGHAHTPFIFLSAVENPGAHLEAFKYGAIDFIQKPIGNELFLSKIKSILQSYRATILMNSIVDKGTEQKLALEQIIALCEEERLSGFAFLFHNNMQAVVSFEKGILKDISSGILSGPAAFENMSSWKQYRYFIVRGHYSADLAKLIKEQI